MAKIIISRQSFLNCLAGAVGASFFGCGDDGGSTPGGGGGMAGMNAGGMGTAGMGTAGMGTAGTGTAGMGTAGSGTGGMAGSGAGGMAGSGTGGMGGMNAAGMDTGGMGGMGTAGMDTGGMGGMAGAACTMDISVDNTTIVSDGMGGTVNAIGAPNHAHTLVVPLTDLMNPVDTTYTLGGGHMHTINVTAAELMLVAQGMSVTVAELTSITNAHQHQIQLVCGG